MKQEKQDKLEAAGWRVASDPAELWEGDSMYLLRLYDKDEYEEYGDVKTLFGRIDALLDEGIRFDVYECDCIFDRT